jgi:hypothetical protein
MVLYFWTLLTAVEQSREADPGLASPCRKAKSLSDMERDDRHDLNESEEQYL